MLERDGTDTVFEPGHGPRGEPLPDERAHPGVPGRIHREERHDPVGVGSVGGRLEGDAVRVGEGVDVAERGEHVLVAGERPEVELVAAVDRCLATEPRVRGVRVLVDVVGVGAESGRTVDGEAHRAAPLPRVRPSAALAGGARGALAVPTGHQSRRSGDEAGDVGECHVAHAGHEHRPEIGGDEHRDDHRVRVGADRGREPPADVRADAVAEVLDVRVGGEQGLGRRGDECRAPADDRPEVLDRADDPFDDRLVRLGGGWGYGAHVAPEQLREQVVLRAEVGVGGGRRDPGATGHVAHRQSVVAGFLDLELGRVDQLIDRFGLTFGQPPPRRLVDQTLDHRYARPARGVVGAAGGPPDGGGRWGVPSRIGG